MTEETTPDAWPETIHAHRIMTRQLLITDADGRLRIGAGCDENGRASFMMTDVEGTPCVSISVYEDGTPTIAIHDAGGTFRLMLQVIKDRPCLVFQDPQGNPRARFWLEGGDLNFAKIEPNGDGEFGPINFLGNSLSKVLNGKHHN